jgi:hypothetical protein
MALNEYGLGGARSNGQATRGLWWWGSGAGYSKSHLVSSLLSFTTDTSFHIISPFMLSIWSRFLQGQSFADHALPSFDFGYTATDKLGGKSTVCWESLSVIASLAEILCC